MDSDDDDTVDYSDSGRGNSTNRNQAEQLQRQIEQQMRELEEMKQKRLKEEMEVCIRGKV